MGGGEETPALLYSVIRKGLKTVFSYLLVLSGAAVGVGTGRIFFFGLGLGHASVDGRRGHASESETSMLVASN